ncbi:putative flavin-containing monoamine oxidase AofH [Streptomyces spinoverrucosus]|uniref:Putative flavin-containing monoamine oxidase AofH n=1 Tax=Streptomyces spinoverrucosus TaxID=284043 RepID=A0A4Y3VQY8_9ACTN|nr:NAD(P)/FAD-dependent oxidoreductase [Streptomyces spinoverrucosus]GEC08099.1 putative flavin-containing monoamine oxidase AofH [Streptomyces spinoverrucosus]GHB64808.1 putative flavin-containing monoamine oxidase AofH [Streptomyces spinoverrucosus]
MSPDTRPGDPAIPEAAARGTGRRTVLKAASLTALLGATGVSHAAAAESADAGGGHDVIVIGAGFAGVAAARELRRNGLRPLILEAQRRIGGRTYTADFAGERVEMGGAWFDEGHPHAWKELLHYGLQRTTDEAPDVAYFPAEQGSRAYTPAEGFGRLAELVAPVFDGSQQYFPRPLDPFAREDLVRPLDRMTLIERIDAMNPTPVDRKWLTGYLGGLSGGDSARGSLTQMAQWWALSDWNFDTFSSGTSSRLVHGTAAFIQAMLEDADADLRLNAPVSRVEDRGSHVRVTTRSGAVFHAPFAVVAVPVNVWNRITFAPGLPAEHRGLAEQTVAVPQAKKLWLHLRTEKGLFYASGAEGDPGIADIVPTQRLTEGHLAFAFSTDPALKVTDRAQIQASLRRWVPDVEVLAVKGHDWGNDPYARGGWTYKRPGQLTGPLRAVQRPVGRLSFATSDIALGWSGWVDGAIESGLRAAGQVLDR